MLRLSTAVVVVLAVGAAGCGNDGGTAADRDIAITVAGSPTTIAMKTPDHVTAQGDATVAMFVRGRQTAPEAGCLACHQLGDGGNDGPGSPLTHVGAKLTRAQIRKVLVDPPAPMPSFEQLPADRFDGLVVFLSELK